MLKSKILFYLTTISVISALLSMYYSGEFRMGAFYNADALYVPDLVTDLHNNLIALLNWNLSRAPSFIDVFLFYLISLVVSNYHSISVFFTLQIITTVYLVYSAYRHKFDADQAAVFTSSVIILFAFLVLNQNHPYFLILKSAHHYITFLVWIYASLFWVRFLAGNEKGQWIFFLLIFIQCTSDQLFIIHFVLPCLLMGGFLLYPSSVDQKRRIIIFSVKIVSVVSCTLLLSYLMSQGKVNSIGNNSEWLNINFLKIHEFWLFYNASYPVLSVMTVIFYVLALIQVIRNIQNNVLLGFLLLSLLVTISVLTVSDKNILGRYLLPYLFSPILLVFYVLPTIKQNRLQVLYLLLSGVAFLGLLTQIKFSGFKGTYYPDHVACVDQALEIRNINSLVGDYWAARHYTFLSKNVTIDPFRSDFKREYKVNNPSRFVEAYSGFLVDSIDGRGFTKFQIEKQFGPPREEIACSKATVLIYNSESIIVDENNTLTAL